MGTQIITWVLTLTNPIGELRLRRLIDEAYSTDKVTRAMARAKLKQRYPEIYKICDFSKERK